LAAGIAAVVKVVCVHVFHHDGGGCAHGRRGNREPLQGHGHGVMADERGACRWALNGRRPRDRASGREGLRWWWRWSDDWENSETDEDAIDKELTTAHIEGASGVPSDGVPHQVSVAVLQPSVKNTGDYRLLPGPVHAFVDSFISKTAIVSDIAPGDHFNCMLGADLATCICSAHMAKRAQPHNCDEPPPICAPRACAPRWCPRVRG